MSILVPTLVVTAFLVLGIAGALRGVRASLLALVGTLLGVLLVDLWQEPWGEWVRTQFKPENPAFFTWVLSTTVFFVIVMVAGLGSSVLLPAVTKANPKPKTAARDRLAGGGLGLLNGALVSSYLLHFAQNGLSGQDFDALLAALPPLGVLYSWLPWFMLTVVVAAASFVLVRGAVRLAGASAATRQVKAPPASIGPVATAASLRPSSQSSTGSLSAKDKQALLNQLNEKINTKLEGDQPK